MSKILANQIANYLDNSPIEIKEGLNIPSGKPLQVNGSIGSTGQVLSTDGTGLVWANAPYFDGNYNNLTNKPSIPAAQVNADWSASSGVAQIFNKPFIPPLSSVVIGPASGGGSLIFNNVNGEFTFTPPDLSSYSTFSGAYADLSGKPDLSVYLTSYTETDPVFTASPVGSVTSGQIANWNNAYGWGNHASAGYLTAEADTFATVVARGGTTTGNIQVNDITVNGNFSVIGTSTTNNVATLNVTANQIIMNDGVTGAPSLNGTIKVERGTLPDSIFRWNETSDRWEFSNDGTNFYNLATGNADLANTAGYITTYAETDPLFTASAASGIGASDITNWNTAYGWGNHATGGYLTAESDTLDSVVNRGATTSLAATFGDLTCSNLTVTGTTTEINTVQLTVNDNTIVLNNDVSTTPTENAGIEVERGLSSNVRLRWNEATDRWTFTNDGSNYFVMPTSIGDLANDVGYLTSFTETDPVFTASVAFGITSSELANWNAAYNWGNHATAGYLTGLLSSSVGDLSDVNVSGPATGELLRYNASSSKWENWSPNYLTAFVESDPIFSASAAAGINNTNIVNWNTAYTWGNHAAAGYLTNITSQPISNLSNVSNAAPSDGQALVWNASGSTWQPGTVSGGGGGGSSNVPTQDDAPSSPTDGDLWWESDTAKLKVYYDDGNTAQWVDASPAGGGGASNVSGLSDVSLTSPQDGDILRYNAGTSEWVNTANNVSTLNTAYFGVGDPGTGTPSIVQIEGLGAGGALELSNGGSPVAISFDFNTGTAGQVITATGNDGFGNATGATWSDAPAPSASVYFDISGGTGTGYILDGGGFSNTASNPTIYVYRGFTYSFNNTTGSSHPFALRQTSGGTAVSGVTGSQTGEQFWTVPMSLAAGTTYVYQCTIHSAMVGNIVVV
jgi:hypothetical protein|tara:strand:- start:1972 stop:4692 length:2721 start_codon:yes stop_codon:yes gene_type:complete